MYQDCDGNRVLFAAGVAHGEANSSATLTPQTDVFVSRISKLVPMSPLLQEFNAAARIPNPVQQFVAFWGLLTHVVGKGSVNAVEVYLHSHGVPDEPTPGPHGPETKFARVRGEIRILQIAASESPTARPDQKRIAEARDIVRTAVADKLGLPR